MKSGLLVNSIEERGLVAFVRKQRGGEIELKTLSNLVVELDLSAKNV